MSLSTRRWSTGTGCDRADSRRSDHVLDAAVLIRDRSTCRSRDDAHVNRRGGQRHRVGRRRDTLVPYSTSTAARDHDAVRRQRNSSEHAPERPRCRPRGPAHRHVVASAGCLLLPMRQVSPCTRTPSTKAFVYGAVVSEGEGSSTERDEFRNRTEAVYRRHDVDSFVLIYSGDVRIEFDGCPKFRREGACTRRVRGVELDAARHGGLHSPRSPMISRRSE